MHPKPAAEGGDAPQLLDWGGRGVKGRTNVLNARVVRILTVRSREDGDLFPIGVISDGQSLFYRLRKGLRRRGEGWGVIHL